MRSLFFLLILSFAALLPQQAALASDSGTRGGGGGSPYRLVCPDGAYLIGFTGNVGAWIDHISPICQRFNAAGQPLGEPLTLDAAGSSQGGRPKEATCPPHTVVAAMSFNTTRTDTPVIQNLVMSCMQVAAPHDTAAIEPELRSDGGAAPESGPLSVFTGEDPAQFLIVQCGSFELGQGIYGTGGLYVDSLGLVCGGAPAPVVAAATPPPPRVTSIPHSAALARAGGDSRPAFPHRVLTTTASAGAAGAGPEAAPVLSNTVPADVRRVYGIWQSSQGELKLTQDGVTVEGSYEAGKSRLSGEVRDNAFSGFWAEDSSSTRCVTPLFGTYFWGKAEFAFNDATNQFTGAWSYCDAPTDGANSWNGTLVHH